MGAGSGGGAPHPEPRLPVGRGITPRRGKPHKSIWVSHKSIWGHPINPNYTGSSHLAGQANPSDLRALIRGFKTKKKLDKRWKKLPHPPGWVGAHGNHLQMSAHPSRMWERPLLLQNNPKKKKKINILGAVSPPHRLPPAAPLAAPALAGIIFAPRLINGVVTRQISSAQLLLRSPRAVGGGNAGFHSDALGFNQGSSLGELITESGAK